MQLSLAQHRLLGLGKWTIGAKYSLERSGLILKDNPRANIDSMWMMSDSLYILHRQNTEKLKWNYTVGLTFERRLKSMNELVLGLNYVKNGTSFIVANANTTGLEPMFDWMNQSDTIYTKNSYLELPVMLKWKLAPNVKHEKSMTGARLLSLRRILYGGLGFSLSYPINDDRFWNEIEYSGLDPSIGLNGVGMLGINQIYKSRLNLDVGLNFRYNFTSMYPYAPVLTKYYSYGVHVKAAYTLKYKPPKGKKRIDLSCRNFIHTPQPKDELFYQYGFIFGVVQSNLAGADISDELLAMRPVSPSQISTVNSSSGSYEPFYGAMAGLRGEYFIAPKIASVGLEATYSQNGIVSKFDYFGLNQQGESVTVKTKTRTFTDYVNLNLSLKIRPIPYVYALGGFQISTPVNDEVYSYYQVIKTEDILANAPYTNEYRVGKSSIDDRWGEKLNPYPMGVVAGIGFEFDNYLDIMLRYQNNNIIFEKKTHELNYKVFQIVVYYNLFNRDIYKEN